MRQGLKVAALSMALAIVGASGATASSENWFIFGKGGLTGGGNANAEQRRTVRQKPRTSARQQASIRQSVRSPQRAATAVYQPPEIYRRTVVDYHGPHGPGTIVIDTGTRHLYHIQAGGKAVRYGVGVGKAGFEWSGSANIARKAKWPDWRPPAAMIAREKAKGRDLPAFMPGGPENPLGARALYLYQGGHDTLYRIHGTNNPRSIGLAMSSGCIRMMNSDVEHLYENVRMGAKVVVL
ncbi:MAG: L,D-transpeptidase [Pseudomonadota bacterium]